MRYFFVKILTMERLHETQENGIETYVIWRAE